MPGQGRLGDKAQVQGGDSHGCPACPHTTIGPAEAGSPNVNINGKAALRKGDTGRHAACCGPGMWTANAGSSTVNINGKPAFRMNDAATFCGGSGKLSEGSSNVIVGDGGGGGGGGGAGGGSGSASGGSTSAGQGGKSGTYSGSSQASGGGSAANQAANQSSPANASNAAPGSSPASQPQKATAQWKTVWSDDQSSVGGLKSLYDGGGGAKELMGGSGSVPGVDQGADFSVTLKGTVTVSGKVTDYDGKGVAGVKVRVERAFGDPIDVETDSSGTWKAEGFVQDEPYHAEVVSVTTKAEGTLVDENQRPMAGVQAILRGDAGTVKRFTSDAQGKYSVEGLLPGEGYHIEVVNTGRR